MKCMTSEDHKLLGQGKSFSEIPVMSTEGIHDVYLFDRNVNGERFQEFTTNSLHQYLIPSTGAIFTLLSSWIMRQSTMYMVWFT